MTKLFAMNSAQKLELRTAVGNALGEPNLSKSLMDASSWSAHTKMFSATDTSAATIYWPSVIDTTGIISSPLDRFYMYFSTDHDAGVGGIYLATAPTPLGPWTQRGLVFVDPSTANGQTETPSVVWDIYNGNLRMFYQQVSARYGAGSDVLGGGTQAIGDQSTLSATSTNGVTWTKDTSGFVLQLPGTNLITGDGHTGYFTPQKTMRGLIGYSLCGGGQTGRFVKWQCDGPLDAWRTDYRALSLNLDLINSSPVRRSEWNSANIVESGGVEYWVGSLSNGAFGLAVADNVIAVAPISSDYRSLLAKPAIVWTPTESWETGDMRSSRAFISDGILYIYYSIAKTDIGVISHAL